MWVLTRNPLDPFDDEFEYDRVRFLAQDLLVDNLPDLDLENEMSSILQGLNNGCRYGND